jgi:hypothetical protein
MPNSLSSLKLYVVYVAQLFHGQNHVIWLSIQGLVKRPPPDNSVRSTMGFCQVQKTIRMLIIVHYMVGNNAFFGWGSKYGQNHVIWLSIYGVVKQPPPDQSVRSTMGFCQMQKTIRMLIIVHYMVGNNAFFVV